MKPISAEDLRKIRWITRATLSPAGDRVACVVRAVGDEHRYVASIWVIDTADGSCRHVTDGSRIDDHPSWSSDGTRLAFTRGNVLSVLCLESGTVQELHEASAPSAPVWSPGGEALVFSAPVVQREVVTEDAEGIPRYHRFTELMYKADGQGFWDGSNRQLFVYDLTSGTMHQLTRGPHDHLHPAWSPDGEHIAFAASRGGDYERTRIRDIWRIRADGSGEPTRLTSGIGPASYPCWSPCGQQILYYCHDNKYAAATYPSVWTVPASGGDEADLLTGFDRPVEDSILDDMNAPVVRPPQWSRRGDQAYFLVTDRHSTHVYRVPSAGGKPQPVITGQRRIFDFSFDGRHQIAFLASDCEAICDLHLFNGKGERRLTRVNDALLRNRALGSVRHVTYRGAGGRDADAWLMTPAQCPEGAKLPMVVQINRGRFGYSFYHEFHVLAGEGIGVLYSNIAGAYAYGQDVKNMTHYTPGKLDLADVMTSVDAACDLPAVDPDRLGIMGGSYGGWMTNWSITRTNRFRTAISQRSVSNRHSHWGTGDINYFRWGGVAVPWSDPQAFLDLSPLQYADRIQTPLLLIHSDQDHRCPLEQSEQLFTALRYQDKEAELVVFHGEGHNLSRSGRPENRVARLQIIMQWLRRYLIDPQ